MSAPYIDDDARLELEAADRRFVDPETEAAYVVWQRDRTMSFNRAANASAFAGLLIVIPALLIVQPADLGAWLGIMGVLAATSAGLRLLGSRERWRRWFHVAVAATNAVWGSSIVLADTRYLDAVELGAGVAVLTTFFAFAVNRTRPAYAAVAASTYVGIVLVALVRAMADATLPRSRGVFEVGLVIIAFASGLRAALTIDAEGRRTYRQERIIEAQKETIARERARSEELLKRELSHQVAERSRELGAVLAKSDVTLDVRALKTGERFAERYRIVSALGAGGMGAVYEVERATDGSKLALKVVVGEVSGASAARFAREAEIGARVRHVNLISIVDVGVSSGVPFLVMELVRGGSLESQRAKFGDVAWALPILKQIAEGLAALHEAGVVHRDLKPANVLLADGGVAKISDFGISRFGALDEGSSIDASADTMAASPKPRSSELTGTGVVMGTPLYMAPEGARSARALDSSADVFAFGIIAYEMLTGRSPFPVPAFMLALAEQPIPVPAAIDDARVAAPLRALVLAAVAGDPAQRPRARSVVDALAR